ncbi:MAG: hypothetical protein EVA65_03370 [Oceanococcus sp.]|nr:MAG: hypothetical protein EVA65_03370 [Oceanococcus sp.]
MSQKSEPKLKSRRRKRREVEPLKVNLTVAVRFGEDDEDRVVLLDDREVHMIGSIFRYRDKIARYTVTGLFRAAMLQPKVAAKLVPALRTRRKKD